MILARAGLARTDDADTLVKVELVTDEVTMSDQDSVALYLRISTGSAPELDTTIRPAA